MTSATATTEAERAVLAAVDQWLQGTKTGDGQLLWRLQQGEPYLRTTFKGTTAEMNKVLVDHLAGKGKLPEPVKAEPGFGPEYQGKK